jgi:hypothetical protein
MHSIPNSTPNGYPLRVGFSPISACGFQPQAAQALPAGRAENEIAAPQRAAINPLSTSRARSFSRDSLRRIPASTALSQVIAQFAAAAGVAKAAQRLGLDLADALAGNPELLAHLF